MGAGRADCEGCSIRVALVARARRWQNCCEQVRERPNIMHIRLSPTSYRHSQLHPFAAPMTPPIPVVSNNHDTLDDENDCPVCLEPLSFSFRLPGEKPHVVPECGHALHEVSSAILPVIFPTHTPPGLFHSRLWPSSRPEQIAQA